jgi:hypothetical protein
MHGLGRNRSYLYYGGGNRCFTNAGSAAYLLSLAIFSLLLLRTALPLLVVSSVASLVLTSQGLALDIPSSRSMSQKNSSL